jgi:hypothetical protein
LLAEYVIWGRTPFGLLLPYEKNGAFPMTITMQTIRDFIVVGIYIALLGGQMWLWSSWQKRGQKPTTDIVTSDYGRPLVKRA